MDSYLVDYLNSGRCWVLIGSGPSTAMGYPPWKNLAAAAITTVRTENATKDIGPLESAFERHRYDTVFDHAWDLLTGPRLLQVLKEELKPSRSQTSVYEHLARWPVPVYLTTNYDDELQKQLAKFDLSYVLYQNSEDHLGHLNGDLDGAIFKLHGDLRSRDGLILTAKHYKEISNGDEWAYWRIKMTSVFQMNPVVVVGHSLTDPHIRHVLEAAKAGAGVERPICWIAPDVPRDTAREFLEKYRVRIISYNNQEGDHRNLIRLVESVSDFVPPRTTIRLSQQIANLTRSQLGTDAAAPGFYVFNKIASHGSYEERRLDIIIAAILAAEPKLRAIGTFSLSKALTLAGWPPKTGDDAFKQSICEKAVSQGILVPVGSESFAVSETAAELASGKRKSFEHDRERFRTATSLRTKREFPTLDDTRVERIVDDIEASLTGFFSEGGLTLASILFSSGHQSSRTSIPTSIIKFINAASARYDDQLMRQAFFKAATGVFVHSGLADRDYLGRISQGFFAFHALGVFGDVAIERLRHAKETVWLVDSDTQIPLLALAAPTNSLLVYTISRLRTAGVRLFTTEQLFEEAYDHFLFANWQVGKYGTDSDYIIAGARGEAPYQKQNQFLEGFIRWRSNGNVRDWEAYLYAAFGSRDPKKGDIQAALVSAGIEVVGFENWPGFTEDNRSERSEYLQRIGNLRSKNLDSAEVAKADPYKKAGPEAEALLVVNHERDGTFCVLSEPTQQSPSWFISHTSILNRVIDDGLTVTWQPEAFLSFASTLSVEEQDPVSSGRAFEALLWNLAQSGLTLLEDDAILRVFGGVIDQASLRIVEQRDLYEQTIAEKYGEPLETLLGRVPRVRIPMVQSQLLAEMLQVETERRKASDARAEVETKRAREYRRELQNVEHFRRKMEAKRSRNKTKKKKTKKKKKRHR